MPRPTRIQYENAFYHVMNRGRGRQTIFHNKAYYLAFLKTLEEAHNRFDAVIHAYCLMGNHYHLIIETPRANLERIMRHVNGVYTQRYNRLKKTDGPLFRGRYKAILVDEDAYLLQLSRYIHRNPAEIKGKAASVLNSFQWSSYLAYINEARPEAWLARDKIYQMLGKKQKYAGYKAFVGAGIDEDTAIFYNKGNTASVLGDLEFKEFIMTHKAEMAVSGELSQALSTRPSSDSIVLSIAEIFNVVDSSITARVSGRQKVNLPRKVAMYCCQEFGDIPLKSIANKFGLKQVGSVSSSIHHVRECLMKGELTKELELVRNHLGIIK